MIHRSGNPFMQSQQRRQPMRLNSCASRQVLSVLPNETPDPVHQLNRSVCQADFTYTMVLDVVKIQGCR
jgi:hypothetical protein